MPEGATYLGMPLFWGRTRTKWFHSLICKIQGNIASWKQNDMRSCLVQAITNTSSNCLMSCHSLPKQILRKINQLQSTFWWGKSTKHFCRFIKWLNICRLKCLGGVGIRWNEDMSIALLTKLAWRNVANPDSLFSKLMAAKYAKTDGWWPATHSCGPSTHAWQNYMAKFVGLLEMEKNF